MRRVAKPSSYIYIYILVVLLNLFLVSFNTPSVSALSYSSDIGVSFTFLPTLKLVLSSDSCGSGAGSNTGAELCINNLSPGTASDSNILTITVLNNTGNGYTLNASVGSDTEGSGRFNTRDLVHKDSTITNSFTSLAFNSSITTNTSFTDNTWGFSYMDETLNNPTWSNYSGLPLFSSTTDITTLKTSLSPATSAEGDKIKFKIAAKSANTQASGEYNNVINFTVTSQPIPVTLSMAYENAGKEKHNGYYKLQDMNTNICNATEVLDEGSQMQAIDIRDNKVYWITKLQDGHCWMTQNLDLSLDSSVALTDADTDLNTVTSWTPMRSTINAVTDENTAGSIQGWADDVNTPYSIDTGDYYWKNTPFYDSNLCSYIVGGVNYQGCNYVTKADANWKNYFATTPYASNKEHGHVGNYYNWSAAVANNDTSAYTTSIFDSPNNNPPNSICPKGWRLPTITSASPDYTQANSRDEFSRLAYLYDNYTGNTSISSEGLEKAPLYMPRPGHVYSGTLARAGYNEHFWSSSVYSATNAYTLGFGFSVVSPQHSITRYSGFSLRCLAR